MSPEQYAALVAVPTLREALRAREDRRLNYLACISIFHVLDYLAATRGEALKAVQGSVRQLCPAEFAVVQGVCNGTKHAGGDRGQWLQPGAERVTRPFGFGPKYAGFGEGRWGYPGLAVAHGERSYFLDRAAQVVLLMTRRQFPAELGSIDLTFFDPDICPGGP